MTFSSRRAPVNGESRVQPKVKRFLWVFPKVGDLLDANQGRTAHNPV